MNTISNLTLDLQRPNATEIAYAVQNDSATRKIKARLLNGSEDWTPPEGTFFVIRYAKPDGKIGLYSATEDDEAAVAVNGSEAVITLAAQAINVPGEVVMQMNMYNADRQKLSTFNWIVIVTEAPVSDTEIVSSDYFNVLTEQIAAALGGIDTRVEEATREAIEEAKAEIAAKGQQTKDSIPDDYSDLSGKVTANSADLVKLLESGDAYIGNKFVRGDGVTILPGLPYGRSMKTRIYLTEMYPVSKPITISIDNGYRAYVYGVNPDETYYTIGWKTGEFECNVNSQFIGIYVSIAAATDISGEADVEEFRKKLVIKNAIGNRIDTKGDYTVPNSFANLIYETIGLYVDENGDICQREDK